MSSPTKLSPKLRCSFLAAVTMGGAGRGVEDGGACLIAMARLASWRLLMAPWTVEAALKPGGFPGSVVCAEFNKITLSLVIEAGLTSTGRGGGFSD